MDIPDLNLFMMCKSPNPNAARKLPAGYTARRCRKSELDVWKAIHFDDSATAEQYRDFMSGYFRDVYAAQGDLFFEKCIFVCDPNDTPVGTCFLWKAYDRIQTLHWFKVVKSHEGKGIGRALLSAVLQELPLEQYPVYLHTQPGSFRAIKLYSDFGFAFLSDPIVGFRSNDLGESLVYLEKAMPQSDFANLRVVEAPEAFLEAVRTSEVNQF